MSDGSQLELALEEAFRTATKHHQASQFAQAEAIYRQILNQKPRHPDALHQLGLIAIHAARFDVATELIQQAIALNPSVPQFHCNLGIALAASGATEEASDEYRR